MIGLSLAFRKAPVVPPTEPSSLVIEVDIAQRVRVSNWSGALGCQEILDYLARPEEEGQERFNEIADLRGVVLDLSIADVTRISEAMKKRFDTSANIKIGVVTDSLFIESLIRAFNEQTDQSHGFSLESFRDFEDAYTWTAK